MRKSLFEYSKDKKGLKSDKSKEERIDSKNFEGNKRFDANDKPFDEEEVKKKVDTYSKLSEGELLRELYKEVNKQKSTGSFDINQLASQLDNIRPMLSEKQNANLENILKNLKK